MTNELANELADRIAADPAFTNLIASSTNLVQTVCVHSFDRNLLLLIIPLILAVIILSICYLFPDTKRDP